MNDKYCLRNYDFVYRQFVTLFFKQIGKSRAAVIIRSIEEAIKNVVFAPIDFEEGEIQDFACFMISYLLSKGFLYECSDDDPYPKRPASLTNSPLLKEKFILEALNEQCYIRPRLMNLNMQDVIA
jgi:hypothetical protein